MSAGLFICAVVVLLVLGDEMTADHWAQIGWFGSLDVEGFYTRLAEGLAAREL